MVTHNNISFYNEVYARGDPILSDMVILCLEIIFILIKNDPNIERMEVLKYCYLCTACTDDTTFFLKDGNYIVHLSEKLKVFSDFLGLKSNTTKCEIAGISVPKGVQATVYGTRYIDLKNEAIKILSIYFSYSEKIKDETSFYDITSNIKDALNLWRIRNLTLD